MNSIFFLGTQHHAVTVYGFELKITLFVIAFSVYCCL